MIVQIVPRAGKDVLSRSRDKVTHRSKNLVLVEQSQDALLAFLFDCFGYKEVSSADGVLVAQIKAGEGVANAWLYLIEKLLHTDEVVDWFEEDLVAINLQFIPSSSQFAGAIAKNACFSS